MINLPPQLTPSELLCCEELPPFIDELLRGSRSLRIGGELPRAERCALDAVEASQEAGTHVSRGAALIHLADVHREMGRLGPALADCRQAYRTFQRQASHYQRHSEGVAAYALGLVHQLLGSDVNALKWYQESSELLERVKKDWAAVNALTQVETCTRVQHWMETLSGYLTSVRTQMDASIATRIWVPIVLSGADGGGFSIAELEIDKYRVERELTINGESFHVRPLKGKRRIFLEPGLRYYVLEIPDAARASLGASEGDYALIGQRQDADKEGPGVLETLGGPEFGHFERDDEGSDISFVRTDATVIGAEDISESQIGYIAALLKPT